jgi:hypothetical protein
VRALVDAHHELRELDKDALIAIAVSDERVSKELVRLHRRVSEALATSWYDTADLRRTAVEVIRAHPGRGAELGQVIVFLPQDVSPGAAALIRALMDVRIIAAATGGHRADSGITRTLERLGADAHEPPPTAPAIAKRILHASDADDEVRCVVRMLTERLQHTPGHRTAILYGRSDPYARLIAEHLQTAKIEWNGTSVRPTIERTLARTLLDVLALPEHGWRRSAVLAVLSGSPVKGADGGRVPASQWERLSRAAGIVGGNEWDIRLKAYAVQQRATADEERSSEEPREGFINRLNRDADAAETLRTCVVSLMGYLAEGAGLRTWPELASWTMKLFEALIGDIEDEPWLPDGEARAHQKLMRTLEALAGLGAIEPTADLAALRLTLELELAGDLPRHGNAREGVFVGPLSAAIGLAADEVFVVGVAEDLVPGRGHEDALLPERVRALTGGQLPPQRDRLDRQHRHLLAALAAAPEVTVSFPRGDLRRGGVRLPSRWLLPSLRTLSGDPRLEIGGWPSVSGDWLVDSPSYATSLERARLLSSEQEWRTRLIVAHRGGILRDTDARDDIVLGRAMTMLRARASDALTRFDGDLSGLDIPGPASADQVVSPTSLEAWVSCPHGYLVKHLLRVYPVESPEEIIQISAMEVGKLVHVAVDRFFTTQAAADAVPGGSTPWTAAQRAELRRIAIDVAGEFEARGVVGHRVLWRQELNRILIDLDALLDDDEEVRAATGRRQERSELTFGMGGEPPVTVALPDGRTVRFRGSADRVDRAGDALVVVDYKTGKAKSFDKLTEDDPTAGGSKLQLPVYAYAARAALGKPDGCVSAEYWFLRRDRGNRVIVPLTDSVQQTYLSALTVIVDGISAGMFPHRPPPDDGFAGFVPCDYCDTDGLGAREHRDRWEHKRRDPRLAAYVAMVEPEATT